MNELLLEFFKQDKQYPADPINEQIEGYSILEQVDPEFADAIYTYEAVQVLTEAKQIETVSELKEKIKEVLNRAVTPMIYVRVLGAVTAVAIIGASAGLGYVGYGVGDTLASHYSGKIVSKGAELVGGIKTDTFGVAQKVVTHAGSILGAAFGVVCGAALVGWIVRQIGKFTLWVVNEVAVNFFSDERSYKWTPSAKIRAIDGMLKNVARLKDKFKDEANQKCLEEAEEKLIESKKQLEDVSF